MEKGIKRVSVMVEDMKFKKNNNSKHKVNSSFKNSYEKIQTRNG